MADDLHTRILEAARAALDDSTSWIGGDVRPFRVYPVDGDALPYTSLWIPGEEVQRQSGDEDDEQTIEAEVEVLVAGFFKAPVAQLEQLLNAHRKQVLLALSAGIELDGVKVAFDYRGCTKDYEGADGEYAELQMRFVAEIAYLASAPDTLSWR